MVVLKAVVWVALMVDKKAARMDGNVAAKKAAKLDRNKAVEKAVRLVDATVS